MLLEDRLIWRTLRYSVLSLWTSSEMFTGAKDGNVDPHGHPYHTTTYLGGSDLYPRCFVAERWGI
ncbi:hypothetical protein HID58_091603 [Brassica napus]|uniref:Uncharacterized protein n=1 Tax=Brassica napus TaxID=3708 RepID=A0ABQ7X1L9_BRANA|nr:hypothetical protein HID58_091603 [Brassica napus]